MAARTATAAKWGRGPTPRDASSPPRAAPPRPPKLQAAWKEDMIGRPYPRSTATAWAFIATSRPPLAAPSSTSEETRNSKLGASAGVTSETESASAARPTTRLLPKRETNAPTSGMARSAPAAAPSRATPSSPSLRPSLSFRAGILTTQVPITTPFVKNTASTAIRGTRRGGSRTSLEINVPAHVLFDGAVVDDAGGGHVLQGEALAREERYVLGAAAAGHLAGDHLSQLVDGLGEDGAGLQRQHQVTRFQAELFARVGAHEARAFDDLAVDLGLEQEVRPGRVDVGPGPEPLSEEHGVPR